MGRLFRPVEEVLLCLSLVSITMIIICYNEGYTGNTPCEGSVEDAEEFFVPEL